MNSQSPKTKHTTIGFVGQGYIGKNYADDFEKRGFKVVRYALEEPYIKNKEKIKTCDIVFIAVPTPTTPKGFDASIVKNAIGLTGKGKIVVIKSTLLPGTGEELQRMYPDRIVLVSPEFLTEATAAHDAAHPHRNIIGIPKQASTFQAAAKKVLSILPRAPFSLICKSREAEYIKYAGNNWFYFKIVFINLIYDLAVASGCDYEVIKKALAADYRIGASHLMPVHQSGTLGSDNYQLIKNKKNEKGGRGAGGHCFIKDYAAFVKFYKKMFPKDHAGIQMLEAMEDKNINLLVSSGKDLGLLKGVYGKGVVKRG